MELQITYRIQGNIQRRSSWQYSRTSQIMEGYRCGRIVSTSQIVEGYRCGRIVSRYSL
jgi:hypothetical protein